MKTITRILSFAALMHLLGLASIQAQTTLTGDHIITGTLDVQGDALVLGQDTHTTNGEGAALQFVDAALSTDPSFTYFLGYRSLHEWVWQANEGGTPATAMKLSENGRLMLYDPTDVNKIISFDPANGGVDWGNAASYELDLVFPANQTTEIELGAFQRINPIKIEYQIENANGEGVEAGWMTLVIPAEYNDDIITVERYTGKYRNGLANFNIKSDRGANNSTRWKLWVEWVNNSPNDDHDGFVRIHHHGLSDTAAAWSGERLTLPDFPIEISEGDLQLTFTDAGANPVKLTNTSGELTVDGVPLLTASDVAGGITTTDIANWNSGKATELVDSLGNTVASVDGSGNINITGEIAKSDVPLMTVADFTERGSNLLYNGDAGTGDNTNFPTLTAFSNDPAIADDLPYDVENGFYIAGNNWLGVQNSDLIPVDTSKAYRLSLLAKSNYDGISKTYVGLGLYDRDGALIRTHNINYTETSLTTLYADYHPGDSVLKVLDASAWHNSSIPSSRRFIIWGYQDYPTETYSRLTATTAWDAGAITPVTDGMGAVIYYEIALNPATISISTELNALSVVPAGTAISNAIGGGDYNYTALSGDYLSSEWTEYSGTISGVAFGEIDQSRFRPGTAYAKFTLFHNFSYAVGTGDPVTTYLTNIRFEEVPSEINDLKVTGSLVVGNIVSPAELSATEDRALIVKGHAEFNGAVYLVPQSDLSMGDYDGNP